MLKRLIYRVGVDMPPLLEDALSQLLDVGEVAVVCQADSERVVGVHGLGLLLNEQNTSPRKIIRPFHVILRKQGRQNKTADSHIILRKRDGRFANVFFFFLIECLRKYVFKNVPAFRIKN